MPEPLLVLDKLSVTFPGISRDLQVVREVSITVEAGRTLGLVGESGSGKSMTALAILGLVPPPGRIHGSLRFQGQELSGLSEEAYRQIRGGAISIVFQDPATALNPVLTIEDQIVETIMLHKRVPSRLAREMAVDRLRQVDIPSPEKRIKDFPHQFSGGMKQRIMIAMALACEPACLILDEPTTALDVTVQAQILDLVERIQDANNTAIILISHDLGIISEIAHEVAVMYAGEIVERAEIADLLRHPRHPYTRGLLESIPKLGHAKSRLQAISGLPPNPADPPQGCRFHPRCRRRTDRCSRQIPTLDCDLHDPIASRSAPVPHTSACWNPEPEPVPVQPDSGQTRPTEACTALLADPLLKAAGVGKDYQVKDLRFSHEKQTLVAVDHVSLELPAGKIVGLVGESGSGKSTFARLLCRLEDPTRGEIHFDGKALHRMNGDALRRMRHRFQPVFQDHHASLNPRLTARETLEEPLRLHGRPCREEDVLRQLEQTGLGREILGRYPHQLSGGQRQRLGLARALAVKPDLLIADEPLSSLDVSVQAQVLNLLMDLQEQHQLALLFISHDLRVVGHLADWVAVMYCGRIMEWAPADRIYREPRHPYTWALLAALPKLKPGRGRTRAILAGDIPSPINPEPGCRFYSRCGFRTEACRRFENELLPAKETAHRVACLRWSEISREIPGKKSLRVDTEM